MPGADDRHFVLLDDGTVMRRQPDGSFRPVPSGADHTWLAALTADEIEAMAASDPDHPPLDDRFWADVDRRAASDAKSLVEIDADVVAFFRNRSPSFREEINSILRRFVAAANADTRSVKP